MRVVKGLGFLMAIVALAAFFTADLEARTKKGDKLLAEGRKAEQRKEWDKALELYEQAVTEDPADAAYLMAMRRVRFQSSQAHVNRGQHLRDEGKLQEALTAFERAYATDPSSAIAQQEIQRTEEMIERAKKKTDPSKPEAKSLTPAEQARQETLARLERMESRPELRPISRQPITLRMTNQPPRVLYETVAKLAGINVVFDPDYRQDQMASRPQSIELSNATLEQALDYLGVMTRSFWKPLSSNTIFVTNDNPTKRRDYEDFIVKVFYINNVTTPQELQEIATNIRAIADIRRVFTSAALNAIIVRGEADKIALAEKLVNDLDRPRPEVVIDVLVMEANKVKTRDLTAAITSGTTAGLSVPFIFTPRGRASTGTGEDDKTTTSQLISLSRISRISTNDYSVTLPGALLQALMDDRQTRVLQSPQVRAADGMKASLRIGDQVPIATGSFQPGIGNVGISPLVNTQFQYKDVGVNVDVTPRVHGTEEVTLHVELEISTVRDRIDIGGIAQPVIGQRRAVLDLRIKQGEVSLLGGLMQEQDNKIISGIPGLANLPLLGRFFSSEKTERNQSELLIALIPHVVRSTGINSTNLKGVAAGTDAVVRMSYSPKEGATLTEGPAPAASEQPEASAAPVQPAVPGQPVPDAPQQPTLQAPPGAKPPEGFLAPGIPIPKPAPAEAKPGVGPAGTARLLGRPAMVQAQIGRTFTVQLDIENAQNVFSAPFRVKFDPQVLRLTDIRAGNLLSGDGKQVIFTRNILNDVGEASVNLNRTPGSGGVNGSGTLAVLTFEAVKPGTTLVAFPQVDLRNSQMQPIQVIPPQVPVTVK